MTTEKMVVAYFVENPRTLEDLPMDTKNSTPHDVLVEIIETWVMSADEYDQFVADLSAPNPRFKGKGEGEDTGETWLAIEIIAPERRTLYVNPEGSEYARYVGGITDEVWW